MYDEHISYLGGVRPVLLALDASHVKDGRWTPAEYAADRRYRAEVLELGFDTADALVMSEERGAWTVYAWQYDAHGGITTKVTGIPDGQMAHAVSLRLAAKGFDTDSERI